MFKLVGSGYRWFSKLMLWKAMLILFGILCVFFMISTTNRVHWFKGDELGKLPVTCFVGIEGEPWFIPFQDYRGQPLKAVPDYQAFKATRGEDSWQLYHYDGEWLVNYQRDAFNQTYVSYTVENGRPVISSCSAGETFWVQVSKGVALAALTVFILRALWRKKRYRNKNKAIDSKRKTDKLKKPERKRVAPKDKAANGVSESVIETTRPQQSSVIDKNFP